MVDAWNECSYGGDLLFQECTWLKDVSYCFFLNGTLEQGCRRLFDKRAKLFQIKFGKLIPYHYIKL